MTHLQLADYAREAAANAIDAHGSDYPPASVAAEFLLQMAYDEADDRRYADFAMILGASRVNPYFECVYNRHAARLAA